MGPKERERVLARLRRICLGLPEVEERLSHGAPTFYVGHRGWLGVRLDRGLDWDELEGILEDAFAEVAPARLVEAAARRTG